MTMKRIVLAPVAVLLLALCSAAGAETGDFDKDPFFPPERSLLEPAKPSADGGWGRDPFVSPMAESAPVLPGGARVRLTGIIYSKRSRLAMIGGEMLREGSMIGEQRLIEIRRRSVILQNPSGGYDEIYIEDFSVRN